MWQSSFMIQRTLPFDMRTEMDLLTSLLGSSGTAKSVAEDFRLRHLSDAHQHELGLSDVQFEKLSAAIELGKG